MGAHASGPGGLGRSRDVRDDLTPGGDGHGRPKTWANSVCGMHACAYALAFGLRGLAGLDHIVWWYNSVPVISPNDYNDVLVLTVPTPFECCLNQRLFPPHRLFVPIAYFHPDLYARSLIP